MKREWMRKKPVSCEICGRRFNEKDEYFFDFAMRAELFIGLVFMGLMGGEGLALRLVHSIPPPSLSASIHAVRSATS